MSSNREIIDKAIESACDLGNIDDGEIIYDVNNFKRQLYRQGLMTNELENFIDNYRMWDNN